jgi:hypothetical protein
MTAGTKPPKAAGDAARAARLQAALRENLKRRKAQARGRSEMQEKPAQPHDSAGIGADKRKV